MEKVYVGWSTSTGWNGPAIRLMLAAIVLVALIILEIYWLYNFKFTPAFAVPLCIWIYVRFFYLDCGPANTDKYITFNPNGDQSFARRWRGRRIPISLLVIAYLDGRIDFVGDDVIGALRERNEFVSYKLTPETFKFLLQQFIPGISSSFYDKHTSKREIADHYDRHSDFFNAFLGDSMVYTCAIFHDHKTESLEDAQDRKMSLVCKKLQLKKGQTLLDIGCGWGSLARHAEMHFGAHATGVTLSTEGTRFALEANKKHKTNVEILTMDYRDIPRDRVFDRISSIEMAEHVGISNFQNFLHQVKAHLADDGVFLMQVSGLKQGANFEDLSWGLFMSQYIFPMADASTPLHWYVRQLELAGFEVRSVETIGRNYSHTLHQWYKNFMRNADSLMKKSPHHYDQRLINLWKIFLAWSTLASGQGSCTCYQLTCIKNTYDFDRDRFVGEDVSGNKIHPDPLHKKDFRH